MIILQDEFNRVQISRHRSVLAAVKAQQAHLKAVRRHNGSNSYLIYGFYCTTGDHTQSNKPGAVSEYAISKAESQS
jgi:hypothetical protein